MKKILLTIAIISAFLLSCKDSKYQGDKTQIIEGTETGHEHEMEEMTAENHSMNNVWVNEIKLNGDKKWQANLETTEGVHKMLELVKSSNPKSVEDYHNLASKLNDEKNTLVKKCTIEGPSHDNLHVFLHPLIEKIEVLKNVSSADEGAEVAVNVQENLEKYYDYFK